MCVYCISIVIIVYYIILNGVVGFFKCDLAYDVLYDIINHCSPYSKVERETQHDSDTALRHQRYPCSVDCSTARTY